MTLCVRACVCMIVCVCDRVWAWRVCVRCGGVRWGPGGGRHSVAAAKHPSRARRRPLRLWLRRRVLQRPVGHQQAECLEQQRDRAGLQFRARFVGLDRPNWVKHLCAATAMQ